MDFPGLDEILNATKAQPKAVAFGRIAGTAPLVVQFNGTRSTDAVAGCLKLKGYAPTEDDTVLLLRVDKAWIIIGAIG